MKIVERQITVRELHKGYEDKNELGVRGYDALLNIRPAYQREFVYNDKQRNEVIHTVRRGFPLNIMYWAVDGKGFELMDGQQRTISLCQYVEGNFSVLIDGKPKSFDNLTPDQKDQILDYKLTVYVCDGKKSEKLDWFEIINIAGVKLTDQERRNAIYTGPWLSDAKKWFSRIPAPAVANDRKKLVDGEINRQAILEIALDWISGGKIDEYMDKHAQDKDAQELWQYWQKVFAWVNSVFPNQDSGRAKLMKGLAWGRFFNEPKNDKLNAAELEKKIVALVDDDEVENKRGIYEYLLTKNEKFLSLRTFDEKIVAKAYEKQKGICPHCPPGTKAWQIDQMEADHIIPWSKKGKTTQENCQMLCMPHNRTKSGK
jgi:hypothetical protein